MAFASALTRIGIGGPSLAYNEIQNKVGSGEAPAVEPNPNVIEPVTGGTGHTWPSRKKYKDKRQAILDDDQDFLNLIEASMPEIIKHLRK